MINFNSWKNLQIFDWFKNEVKDQKNKPTESFGVSGTEIYGGYLEEEYLGSLENNRDRYRAYNKMKKSDGTIKMCLTAVESPVLAATWKFKIMEQYLDSPQAEAQLEFMERIFSTRRLRKSVKDCLLAYRYGFSLFERYFKQIDYEGSTKLKPVLKYMLPRTIEQWMTEDGELIGVRQESYGDIGANVKIDADRLVLFTLDREADDFEGVSLLRTCYGPYVRKRANYKKIAIGNNFLSVPFLKIYNEELGAVDETALRAFANRLNKRFTERQTMSHVVFPKGFKAEEQQSNFDPEKLYKCNQFENEEIIRNFLANFLLLTKGSGSFALSNDLSDFFLRSLEGVAKEIDDTLDEGLVKPTIAMNFNEECMVEIVHSEVGGKGGVKLAQVLKELLGSGVVKSDDDLENWAREKFEMPEVDWDAREKMEAEKEKKEMEKLDRMNGMDSGDPMPMPMPNNPPMPAPKNKMDDDKENNAILENMKKKKITKASIMSQAKKSNKRIKALRENITKELTDKMEMVIDKKVKKIMKFINANKDTQKIYKLKVSDFEVSTSEVQRSITSIGLESASSEIKEISGEVTFAKAKTPNTLKKLVSVLVISDVVAMTGNIDNFLLYSALDLVGNVPDTDQISGMLKAGAIAKLSKEASRKVSALPSKIVNEARNTAYDQYSEEIESWTFYNPDPQAEICQYLAGRTILADDPDLHSYQPPLHYNCATVVIPNLKEFKNNPKPQALTPNNNQLKSINIGVKSANY